MNLICEFAVQVLFYRTKSRTHQSNHHVIGNGFQCDVFQCFIFVQRQIQNRRRTAINRIIAESFYAAKVFKSSGNRSRFQIHSWWFWCIGGKSQSVCKIILLYRPPVSRISDCKTSNFPSV